MNEKLESMREECDSLELLIKKNDELLEELLQD